MYEYVNKPSKVKEPKKMGSKLFRPPFSMPVQRKVKVDNVEYAPDMAEIQSLPEDLRPRFIELINSDEGYQFLDWNSVKMVLSMERKVPSWRYSKDGLAGNILRPITKKEMEKSQKIIKGKLQSSSLNCWLGVVKTALELGLIDLDEAVGYSIIEKVSYDATTASAEGGGGDASVHEEIRQIDVLALMKNAEKYEFPIMYSVICSMRRSLQQSVDVEERNAIEGELRTFGLDPYGEDDFYSKPDFAAVTSRLKAGEICSVDYGEDTDRCGHVFLYAGNGEIIQLGQNAAKREKLIDEFLKRGPGTNTIRFYHTTPPWAE